MKLLIKPRKTKGLIPAIIMGVVSIIAYYQGDEHLAIYAAVMAWGFRIEGILNETS